MDFHIVTPHGSILLFSVDGGRIVPGGPDSSEPLTSGGPHATSIAATRTELEDHAADNAKVDASLV